MTMGICPINKIYNTGTIPHGQTVLARQIPMVRGSQMDFTLNDHGEMSVFEFRGTVLRMYSIGGCISTMLVLTWVDYFLKITQRNTNGTAVDKI